MEPCAINSEGKSRAVRNALAPGLRPITSVPAASSESLNMTDQNESDDGEHAEESVSSQHRDSDRQYVTRKMYSKSDTAFLCKLLNHLRPRELLSRPKIQQETNLLCRPRQSYSRGRSISPLRA